MEEGYAALGRHGTSLDAVTAADLVLVALTVVCLFATAAIAVAVVQLRSGVRQLRAEIREFRDHAVPAAEELTRTTRLAAHQVDRLDDMISVAANVTGTVEGATAATVRVLSNPVIKTAAIARGTRRAARRLGSAGEG